MTPRLRLIAAVAALWCGSYALVAGQVPPKVKVCGLLPKSEVKKLVGGNSTFDATMPTEEDLGSYGSTCNYAGVMIQVLPFQQLSIDAARKRGNLSTVTGVGDGAWLYDNPPSYAELYVKAGARLLVIQRHLDPGQRIGDVRASLIALAKALVAKLR